ncbi:MAG: murein biosynthesis integral membrane protein MurJ [Candidatus Dormibacteria bacterium]
MSNRNRIASATFVVMGAYILSRGLGWAREVVIASEFGTSRPYDAYLVAFIVPDLLVSLVVAGALSSAFIPVLADYLSRGEESEANYVSAAVLNLGVAALALGAFGLFLLAPWFVPLVAPGFSPGDRTLTVNLTRVMLAQPVFLGAGGFVLGTLNSYRRFAAPAMAPLFYNVAIIAAAALAFPIGGSRAIYVLAAGVAVGGLVHLAVQLPSLFATGWRPRWVLDWRHPGVRQVGRLMLPISLGLAATQVNLVVDRVLASILPEGRIAALGYANYVAQVPLGTFSAALAMVVFPYLAQDAALGRMDFLRAKALTALRLNLFVLIPSAAGLAALSGPIIEFVFQRGKFTAASTHETQIALLFFCVGIYSQAGVAFLVRVFYAVRDVTTPLRVAVMTIVVNVLLNLGLVWWPLHLQQGGLALGTSLAATFNLVLLGRTARVRLGGLDLRGLAGALARAAAGSAVMAAMAWGAYTVMVQRHTPHFAALMVSVLLGGAIYLASAQVLRSQELRLGLDLVRRRGEALL